MGGGTQVQMIGQERLRQKLADEYHARQSGAEKDDRFDALFYWDLLGDEDWWKVTLGL